MEPSLNSSHQTESTNTADELVRKENIDEIADILTDYNVPKEAQGKVIHFLKEEVFNGPLPHPDILKGYENVVPGAAQSILDLTIKEQNHRHSMEEKLVNSEVSLNDANVKIIEAEIRMKVRLQLFGFLITGLFAVSGLFFIFQNKNIAGILELIIAIATFIWTMFYGRNQHYNDIDDNNKG